MRRSSLKLSFFLYTIIAIFLFSLPLSSYAKRGCCSRHGGVAGCNKATGYQLCKDGTTSPTCKCDGTTAKQTTKVKATTTESTVTTTPATVTTETVTKTTPVSTKGCCSRHGGVSKCNKKTGFYMCKDGTQSTTCKCQ